MYIMTEQRSCEDDRLSGKHAVVTGASRGIGAAIAATLARRDAYEPR
jgi:NADP-dependent 3-hydroxy acid dehydrogenase YdfG